MSDLALVGVIGLLGLALAGGFAWWRTRYTRGVPSSEISRYIAEFRGYAAPGSVLYIHHEGSKRLLQFARCESDGVRPEVEFGFPDMAWSERWFDALHSSLSSSGFLCDIELPDEPAPVRRFLTAQLEGTEEEFRPRADQLVRVCCTVMDLDHSATFKIRFKGSISKAAFKTLGSQLEA